MRLGASPGCQRAARLYPFYAQAPCPMTDRARLREAGVGVTRPTPGAKENPVGSCRLVAPGDVAGGAGARYAVGLPSLAGPGADGADPRRGPVPLPPEAGMAAYPAVDESCDRLHEAGLSVVGEPC